MNARHSLENNLTMKTFKCLADVAHWETREKRVVGMTDGIRGNCRDQVCMQSEVLNMKSWIHNLGFLDLVVHGKTIQALVDMGAMHNFMTTRLAKEVGLQIFPSDVEVKAVNSRAKVARLAHKVPIQMKDWQVQLDFTVMEMNNFDVIIGQDFLKENRVVIVPFCNEIMLVGGSQTWTFPTHRKRKEVKVQHVSALSLEKAMRESNVETYAIVIREVDSNDGVGTPIPAEIFEVLAKYADLMSDELLKKLRPRHAVDHSIELEPGR